MVASRLGYHASLDGLRAIAVALVMGFHFHVPGFGGGFIGVDVFFVLSGFLITRLLLDEHAATGTISLRRFYARRALRLLPALALLLAVTAPLVARAWTVAAASYLANWFLALNKLGTAPLSHTWSLAIEEQFYIVWPVLLLGLLHVRLSRDAIARIAIALAAASCLAQIVGCIDPDAGTWIRLYHGTDTRADALLIGCAAALLSRGEPRLSTIAARGLLAAAAGTIGYVAVTADLRDLDLYRHGELTLVAVASAVVVTQLVARPLRVLEWRPLVALGTISYGVYLWHHPIAYLHVPVVAKVVLAVAAAATSYTLVERPALALKRRFA
jgi:peptidoglycan/LPS O-acetylase OafA/YrhL